LAQIRNPQLRSIIEQRGWLGLVNHIGIGKPDEQQETYLVQTVGMALRGLPDFVVTGIEPAVAVPALDRLAAAARRGKVLPKGPMRHLFANAHALLMPAARQWFPLESSATCQELGFPEGEVVQVVWSDPLGRFPWDAGHGDGFDGTREVQPLLVGRH